MQRVKFQTFVRALIKINQGNTIMWNKQKDESGAVATPVFGDSVRPPAAPLASVPRAVADIPASAAAIGPSMYIKGEIRVREELLVDGEVEGRVESASLLTVGPNGKIRANIKAREVLIFGSVRGDVEVSQKIAIRGQGSLIGNVKTGGISIDDGAYFKGSIDILRSDPAVSPTPVVAEISSSETTAGRH